MSDVYSGLYCYLERGDGKHSFETYIDTQGLPAQEAYS